ncbi:magnesium/cobalt transporter CorA [Cohnella lubricantis]|uniref:Magnesium transport protein CorA n=1 Tax=Cohnella lubricantis TaxID=2163172 RepID=A0A841TDM3_9BACL|nr:magnesium/cobalt transporter CorA [Cohnella lubricantis]MBB6677077.1 magnesium/cobalt transporter CorA [Cohnella lubricantis]MBP2118924.1 magnesium transporter [Cohnella lubricantis]
MLLYNTHSKAVAETEMRVPDDGEIAWIPLIGSSAEEIQRILSDMFGCHPLIVEDCVTLGQRPKLDRYDKHLLLTFFHVNPDLSTVEIEHVIGPNYVITICPEEVDSLRRAREDFRRTSRYMEYSGSLLYCLLDHCVDDYANVVDKIDNSLDKHERAVFHNPHVRIAGDVFRLKRRLHTLRRILADERVALGLLSHQQFPYSRREADVYFIDIYDHISRVLDSIDSFREAMTALLELQLNMKSDRMNEIMKTLTIISSIFLPLTFLAGVYGMNFRFMPELEWKFGYPALWLIMALVAAGLWWFYKRKKWL